VREREGEREGKREEESEDKIESREPCWTATASDSHADLK
jgi:hypothetical protein